MSAMYYSSSSDSDNTTDSKSLDLSYLMLNTQTLSYYLRNSIYKEKIKGEDVPQSKHLMKLKQNVEDDALCQKFLSESADNPKDYMTEKLFLSHNSILTMPFEVLLFQKLKFLDLSNNNIEEINDYILHLPNLQTLYLKNNKISDEGFPKDLESLTKLKEINLSGNQLTSIPHQLLKIKSLSYLYLGNNSIKQVHPSIRVLQNLQILNLGSNELTSVPHELGELSKLSSLILCNNKIKNLPRSISKLKKLRSLLLHSNNICCLPVEVVRLNSLTELSLRDNPLVTRFVNSCARDLMYNPPSLKELAARSVRLNKVSFSCQTIPGTLVDYLQSGHKCVNPQCKGVYFTSCVQHIKFVDFCGMYRLPLLHYLCSSRCTSRTPAYYRSAGGDTSDSDEEQSMRRVLLG